MTWATPQDLYIRYGDEYVDKLLIRRVWDEYTGEYVADETYSGMNLVLETALEDAKAVLKQKISCCFGSISLLDSHDFSVIKQWHIKLTVAALKNGGDCSSCKECTDFEEFCKCKSICSDDGVCLPWKGSAIYVSKEKFGCDKCIGGCKC